MPQNIPQEMRAMDRFLIYLFTLFIVWPLWFVEQYTYSPPEIIEEVVKTALVLAMVRWAGGKTWKDIVLIGVFFSLSETLIYLFNANVFWSLAPIYWRVLATWPMHIVTVLVIWKLGTSRHKWGWGVGLILAIAIHTVFNWLVR